MPSRHVRTIASRSNTTKVLALKARVPLAYSGLTSELEVLPVLMREVVVSRPGAENMREKVNMLVL